MLSKYNIKALMISLIATAIGTWLILNYNLINQQNSGSNMIYYIVGAMVILAWYIQEHIL